MAGVARPQERALGGPTYVESPAVWGAAHPNLTEPEQSPEARGSAEAEKIKKIFKQGRMILVKNNRLAPNAQNSDTSILFLMIRPPGAHGGQQSTCYVPGPLQASRSWQSDSPVFRVTSLARAWLLSTLAAWLGSCDPESIQVQALDLFLPRDLTAYFEAARIKQLPRSSCFLESKALLSLSELLLLLLTYRSPHGASPSWVTPG